MRRCRFRRRSLNACRLPDPALHEIIASLAMTAARPALAADPGLLNVSYNPTRELYREINAAFSGMAEEIRPARHHQHVARRVRGPGTRRARPLASRGVVTLALAADIDALAAKSGKIPSELGRRLPDNRRPRRTPARSCFLVARATRKRIRDWPDLIRPGVTVITPNPKTSGGARWNYLAALAWAQGQPVATTTAAEGFVRDLFRHVPVLDTGARGATNSFAQSGLGDVLLAWENEAWLALKEFGPDEFEIVYPSLQHPGRTAGRRG